MSDDRPQGAPAPAKGLASSSNPPRLLRLLQSFVIRRALSPAARDKRRARAERKRQRSGAPHRVEYFHQVDDPYSHLAAQTLEALRAAYDIELVPHLSARDQGANTPEPELLAAWARRDAADVAPHYDLTFPAGAPSPAPDQVALAERVLAASDPRDFAERAVLTGRALWTEDKDGLAALARDLPVADESATRQLSQAAHAFRAKLGHYSGAMFHYAGEWYWGVDRLCHLEKRLADLGAMREGARPVAPRPPTDPGDARDATGLTLEFFPSLRSPYSAAIFDRTIDLARRTGVELVLRPVLPMVMRGVPATLAKGRYIMTDTIREAELLGVSFGNAVDPIGGPVEQGFSLFPWAREKGRHVELFSAFVRLAWTEAVDLTTDAGMRQVVEAAGLPWEEAEGILGNDDWRDELEDNRQAMLDLGLWGVPSYKLSGPDGEPDWSAWGQDRLWRLAQEIERRANL